MIGIVATENHRWAHLQHVIMWAFSAHQNAPLSCTIIDAFCESGRGCLGLPIRDEFNSEKQTLATNIADDVKTRLHFAKAIKQIIADIERILRKPSRSITLSTARPAAQETGLPPNVLKYSMPLLKLSATSRVVTTADIG